MCKCFKFDKFSLIVYNLSRIIDYHINNEVKYLSFNVNAKLELEVHINEWS